MKDADSCLAEGDLDGARAALVAMVKADPGNTRARMFLFQLMAVLGEWDKAETQLRSLVQTSPQAEMLSAAYAPMLRAQKQRTDAFAGKGPVPLLFPGPAWLSDVAASIEAFGRGDAATGNAKRDDAFSAAPDTPGMFFNSSGNGQAIQWIADSDPRFGPCFEAFVGGRWGLVAFASLREMKSEGPQDLKDRVWLPVELTLKDGAAFSGFLPVLYPNSETHADAAVRLGRGTVWSDEPSGAGLGQKIWTTDAGDDSDILSLRKLVID